MKHKFTISIIGHPWAIDYLTPKQYVRKWGNDSYAITETDEKCIYFVQDFTNLETIRHELAHAYASQLSLTELQLDDDQVEEFFCELVGKYALTIAMQAETVHAEYVKLKMKKVRQDK